jgi:hypothetical protein
MEIQADGAGFLLGERRLRELANGLGQVHDNTAEILQLLRLRLDQGDSTARDVHHQNISEIARSINRISQAGATRITINLNAGSRTRTVTTTDNDTTISPDQNTTRRIHRRTTNTDGRNNQNSDSQTGGSETNSGAGPSTRNRDSRGRFIGGSAQNINERAESSGGGRSYNINAPDMGGLDPTVDAVRELTGLFSPAKHAFSLMGRGAAWIYKKARPKRTEQLPNEQGNHNDEVERHNYEERKILKKILDAINRSRSGGGLFGSLASLLGAGNGRNGRNGQRGRSAPPTPAPSDRDRGRDRDTGRDRDAGGDRDRNRRRPNRRLSKLFGKIPLLGTLLGAGMVASDWSEQDNGGRGAGIGGLIGTGIGGLLGSFGGPVGTVAGGVAGGMLGERIGQKIGDWTNTLKKDDIGGAIVNRWDNTLDGINKFIAQSWNKMGLGFGMGMMSKMGMGGGMMMASFRRGGSGGGYGGGYAQDNGSTNQARNKKEEQQNQMDVYNSMIGAGFSKSQAQALTAEVGRENGYQSKYLYGAHQDASNGQTNIGMISWQGERAKRLYKSMNDQGFIKDGKMVRSKEALLAQAKFMRQEIETDKSYSKTKQMFKDNPNADPESYAKTLGTNYIGWRYGENKLADGTPFDWQSHNATRRGQLKEIQKKTDGPVIQQPTQAQPAPQQPTNSNGAKPVFVNTAKPANTAKPLYVSNSSKPKQAVDYQFPKIIKKESSTQQQAPMMASNHDAISQNVADREITHAVTGGLGMRSTLV